MFKVTKGLLALLARENFQFTKKHYGLKCKSKSKFKVNHVKDLRYKAQFTSQRKRRIHVCSCGHLQDIYFLSVVLLKTLFFFTLSILSLIFVPVLKKQDN